MTGSEKFHSRISVYISVYHGKETIPDKLALLACTACESTGQIFCPDWITVRCGRVQPYASGTMLGSILVFCKALQEGERGKKHRNIASVITFIMQRLVT